MKKLAASLSLAFLAGCASYDGRGLVVGQSNLDDVTQVMISRDAMDRIQWLKAVSLSAWASGRTYLHGAH